MQRAQPVLMTTPFTSPFFFFWMNKIFIPKHKETKKTLQQDRKTKVDISQMFTTIKPTNIKPNSPSKRSQPILKQKQHQKLHT
jgi:hypothetical protein